jgi:hypothetical protein
VPVQGCTLPYSRAIPLLPLWAVRPVQSLSACTRVTFTLLLHFIMGIYKVVRQEGFDNTHSATTYKVFYNNRNKHVMKMSFTCVLFAKVLYT